jgi:hypothetical protein
MAAERTSSFFDVQSGAAHVLISSTSLLFRRISGRFLVPHHGELPAQATSAEVRQNDQVRRVYLSQRVRRQQAAALPLLQLPVSEAQHQLDGTCPGAFPD